MFDFSADIDFAGAMYDGTEFDTFIGIESEGLIDPELGKSSMDTLFLIDPEIHGDDDGTTAERNAAAIDDLEAAIDEKTASMERTDKAMSDALREMMEAFAKAQEEASAVPSKRDMDGDDLKG